MSLIIICSTALPSNLTSTTREEWVDEVYDRPDSVLTFNVTATIYYPTGSPTASGKVITKNYTLDTHRWCALSRNLLKRWGGEFEYGDTISVTGIHEDVDGIFIVYDAIGKQHDNRIDLLIRRSNKLYGRWDNVTITKYDSTRDNNLN